MEFEQYTMAAFVIIGLINGVEFALKAEWKRFILFSIAVLVGALLGSLEWFGLPNIQLGLALGISSSGVYKIAQKLGGAK